MARRPNGARPKEAWQSHVAVQPEVIEKKNDETSDDTLWGLCWEVQDIGKTHKRLLKEGVKVSEIKNGIKANTLVATIESHTHNIPTLLIEHLDKSND